MTHAVVIGLGNRLRGDDAAGPEAARRVSASKVRAIVLVHETEPTALIGHWAGAELVVIIDALAPAGSPGRVVRIEVGPKGLSEEPVRPSSTHTLSLAEAIELARAIDSLPERMVVFGIEGKAFAVGASMAPAVEAAVVRTASLVVAELEATGVAPRA